MNKCHSRVLTHCPLRPTVTPYSPYWVLSTDYESALVYSCTDVLRIFHLDYAWILSRTRTLPAETVYHAKEVFSREKIDVGRMAPTDQSKCISGV